MYRIQKKKLFLSVSAAALVVIAAFCFYGKSGRQETEPCTIGKYKNFEISVSDPKEISSEEVKNVLQSLCGQTKMRSTEEMEQMVFQSLIQEKIYEAEMEKREAVLREIMKYSTIPDTADDPEEMLLLTLYDKAGLILTEEEKIRGLNNLQDVFGAASAEELECFLTAEEQLRVIKKEKTYEYLLKNNRFVADSSAS